jgi:WD40 repeat protein
MLNEVLQVQAYPQNATGKFLPNRKVTWASGDPLVATVSSDGVVSAVALGNTTVFAASEGIAAQIPVSVEPARGDVDIIVNKLGRAAFPSGLQVQIDGEPIDMSPTGGQLQITLPVGSHTANIANIDAPCELLGEASRVLFVVARQRTTLRIDLSCLLDGQLVVKSQTSGARTPVGPFRFIVDDGVENAIDANGEVRFTLRPKTYQVSLSTNDARCLTSNPVQQAFVNESMAATVQFVVRCYENPPALIGEKLVVSYNSSAPHGLDAMDADGSNRFSVDLSPEGSADPAVSADGRRLAFRRLASTGESHLVVVDLTTGAQSVSTGTMQISSLSWSPDGQRLVTGIWSNGANNLVVLRPDGSIERSLGQKAARPFVADWAPNGNTIAFTSGDHAIRFVDPNGSNPRNFKASTADFYEGARWSPDGRFLMVRAYEQWCYYYSWYCYPFNTRLVVFDAATGTEVRKLPVPDDALGFVWGATVNDVYFIQGGDVHYGRLDNFVPANLTRSPENEWSVLYGRFDGSGAAARARGR